MSQTSRDEERPTRVGIRGSDTVETKILNKSWSISNQEVKAGLGMRVVEEVGEDIYWGGAAVVPSM